MMTVEQILNDTMAVLNTKKAGFTGKKSAIAGQDPASMPGSENDKPIPAGAEAADKEIKDGNPEGAFTPSGAGDDSAVTRGHASEVDEAAEEPVKKPLVDDNAMADAKSATSKLANDLLSNIRRFQTQKQATPVAAKVEKKAEAPKAEAPKAEKKAEAPKAEAPKAEKKAEAPKAEKKAEEPKSASGLNMELTQDVLAKMAAIALSYDEGVEFMEGILEKQAGKEYAAEVIEFLNAQNLEAEKIAAEQQGYEDGLQHMQKQAYVQGIADGFKQRLVKTAKAPVAAKKATLAKIGQDIADASAADAMAAMPAEALPPEIAAEAASDMAAPAEEELTPEDVAAALDMLVSEGAIQPEEAQQVLEYVLSGADAEAMPAEAMPAEAMPAEAMPEEVAPEAAIPAENA